MRVESAKMFLIPSPPKLAKQSCSLPLPRDRTTGLRPDEIALNVALFVFLAPPG
jgi:hypothetical protein